MQAQSTETVQEWYQIRDNWQGRGYRLYFGGERYVTQVEGEIEGRVFRTIGEAKWYCRYRFGQDATRERD